MEFSAIYDLLAPEKLDSYREELEKADNNFTKWEHEDKEALEKSLNEEQRKLLSKYLSSLSILEDEIDYQIGIRTLNWGIKMGIQLQRSLNTLYDYFEDPDYYE